MRPSSGCRKGGWFPLLVAFVGRDSAGAGLWLGFVDGAVGIFGPRRTKEFKTGKTGQSATIPQPLQKCATNP